MEEEGKDNKEEEKGEEKDKEEEWGRKINNDKKIKVLKNSYYIGKSTDSVEISFSFISLTTLTIYVTMYSLHNMYEP